MSNSTQKYLKKIKSIHASLSIPESLISKRNLPMHEEASNLVFADFDENGKAHRLIGNANRSWQAMKTAAAKDNITLIVVSGFRSPEYQETLIRKKLKQGEKIENILKLLAPPGYSEHHTGRALDLNTPGCSPCEVSFEKTKAFEWLKKRAGEFHFYLSYPKDNQYGFVYEPWHWAYQEPA